VNLSASLDLNHNKAERVERDIEAYAGCCNGDTLSFTSGGATVPQFTLARHSIHRSALIQVHDVRVGVA